MMKIIYYLSEIQTEMCLQARDEGTCHESQISYYFDRTKLMCIPFEYRYLLLLLGQLTYPKIFRFYLFSFFSYS